LGTAQAPALLLAALATPLLSYGRDHPPLYSPKDARHETEITLHRIRAAADQQPGDGPVCIRNGDFSSATSGPRQPKEFPGWAALYAIFEPRNEIGGRRIYFSEKDPAVPAVAPSGRRSAELIVPVERLSALGCHDPFLERMKPSQTSP
jgi:hypothetical protein